MFHSRNLVTSAEKEVDRYLFSNALNLWKESNEIYWQGQGIDFHIALVVTWHPDWWIRAHNFSDIEQSVLPEFLSSFKVVCTLLLVVVKKFSGHLVSVHGLGLVVDGYGFLLQYDDLICFFGKYLSILPVSFMIVYINWHSSFSWYQLKGVMWLDYKVFWGIELSSRWQGL